MKILMVSHLRRELGPEVTASRSRVIYNLVAGLIKRGHSISILGSGDSRIDDSKIISIIPQALNNLPPFENQFYAETAYLVSMARKIQEIAAEFDIIHNNTYPEYINLLIEDTLKVPMVTTLHAPVTPELETVLSYFPNSNLVAQSKSYQYLVKRVSIPWVVSNGVDENVFAYSNKPREYLLWIGRLGKSKDKQGNFIDGKGVKDAIMTAISTKRKLIMVGNVEDMDFYNKEVRLYLSKDIQWISPLSVEQSISQADLASLIQKAKALIFSTKFEESFGLVAAEAMSCGTPVLAYSRGSVTEIVKDNETGFLVNPSDEDKRGDWRVKETGIKGLAKAIELIYSMSNQDYEKMQKSARKRVEEYFTIDKMVSNYEALYTKLVKKSWN